MNAKTQKMAQPNATRAAQVTAEVKAKTAKAPKEQKVDPVLTKTIKVLAEKNPKREKTASHGRFALYKSGQTVAQYIDACIAAKFDRRDARADIAWDTKRKFVELTD